MSNRPTSRIASRLARLSLLAATAALLLPGAAQAVPSFARQTGMACEACHTVFPELTPFGRRFKLNGYTMDNLPQVSDVSESKEQTLLLNQLPPLSLMFQTSITSTKKAAPDTNAATTANAQNSTFQFPQQASLFYAGRIAPNLGAFVQMTYGGGSFGWDNTDIRYARNVNNNFLWGLSLNNNPTVQDVWNTTQAWVAPFDQRSAVAGVNKPGGLAMLDGGLGGVAGMSAYGYWNDSLYAELGAYRANSAGPTVTTNAAGGSPVVSGLAPYWRLAYERQWGVQSWEVGAYGLDAKMTPATFALSGPTDHYNDVALDTQYQYIGDQSIYTILGTYIRENESMDASAPGTSQDFKTARIGGTYYYQRKYGAELGYFSTTGSSGFTANDQRAWSAQLDWIPYQNTKLALQYTGFSKYAGTSDNASDNNTLYLLGWINF